MPVFDFHSHILPGADHGSRNLSTSLAQISLMSGTATVVATPHFYPNRDSVRSFLARRERAARELAAHLPSGAPRVFLGAEVLVCAGLHKMEGLASLTVAGTRVILLEMPFVHWNDDLRETVFAVRDMGLTPVLAHIDRYPREETEPLLSKGIAAQLNASALGTFSARRWYGEIDACRVVAFGSDLHGAKSSGYRNFARLSHRLGERAETVFARTAALLENALPLEAALAPVP